jgi:hypothetical protein
MRSQVISISAKAVRFFLADSNPRRSTLKEGKKINVILKFHDGQIFRMTGTILRREKYQPGREHFVCLFERQLPQERISKEQAYLLENFPDFCGDKFSV